jgi:hypothetical protein
MINLMKPDPKFRRGHKDKKHRDKVGKLPCIACKLREERQQSPTEVHHYWGTGAGQKESDLLIFPLCNLCHTGSFGGAENGITIHTNLEAFERNHGTQAELVIETYSILRLNKQLIEVEEYFKKRLI